MEPIQMEPIPVSPRKRSFGLYAFGVVLVAAAGVGATYFAYSNSQAIAAARDTIATEAARGPRVVVATILAGPKTREIKLLGDDIDKRREQLRTTLPIRRVIGPDDIAALAVHIMTNTALTGGTYDIDGGQQLIPD